MARLGLKNYQTPNFKIPTIAPDQRPINQLSKFMQWLHSIVDWKVNDDKKEDTSVDEEKELDEALDMADYALDPEPAVPDPRFHWI